MIELRVNCPHIQPPPSLPPAHPSFLELLSQFSASLGVKQAEIMAARNRYVVGLEKLEFATQQVHRLQKELEALQPVLAQLFRSATEQGAEAGRRVVRTHVQTLQDAAFRLQDLLDHALTLQALAALAQQLQRQGFVVRTGELSDGGQAMGWTLEADLSAA